jgi:hypothetical protein
MSRSLLTGDWAEQLETVRELKVCTKAPEKYMLLDLENGRCFVGTKEGESCWKEVESDEAGFMLETVRQNSGMM